MKRRTSSVIALTIVMALGLAGCSGGTSGGGESGGGESKKIELRYGQFSPPKSLAPATSLWSQTSLYLQSLYDSLLTATPDNEIQPGLATEWEYDESQTTLTLTLRKGVTFADGTEVTPEVVVSNLEHFKSAAGPNSSDLAALSDVTAEGDTVVLTLDNRDPAFLTYLSQNAGMVDNPAAFDRADYGTVPDGTGPYRLEKDGTVNGSSYKFAPTPDYWNPDQQRFTGITLTVYTDPTALTNAALTHQIDAANLSPKNDLAALQNAGFDILPNQLNWTGMSLFDRGGDKTPALKDVRVRQAINLALDRDSLLEALAQGDGTTTTQVFPEYSEGYDPNLDKAYEFDPDEARDLMAEAGYADGFDLTLPTSTALPSSAFSILQQELGDIGIRVTLEDATANFIADVLTPKYSVAYLPLQQGTDWELYNFLLAPTATFNPFHTEDQKLQDWSLVLRDGTPEEADKAAAEMNAYLVEQAWFAPFYRQPLNLVVDPDVLEITVQQARATPSLAYIVPTK